MSIVQILVFLAIAVIAITVIYYLLQQVPIDAEARRIIGIGVVVLVAVIVIYFLLSLGGMSGTLKVP
jgi:hypothetical protein